MPAPLPPATQQANDPFRLPTAPELQRELSDYLILQDAVLGPRLDSIFERISNSPGTPFTPQELNVLKTTNDSILQMEPGKDYVRALARKNLKETLFVRINHIAENESETGAGMLPACDMGTLNLYRKICVAALREARQREQQALRDQQTRREAHAERNDSGAQPTTLSPNEPHPGEPPIPTHLAKRFMVRGNPGCRVIVDWDRCAYLRTITNQPADEKQRLLDAWEAEHGSYDSLVRNQ